MRACLQWVVTHEKKKGGIVPALPQFQIDCRRVPQAYCKYGGDGMTHV
jgi:hypothetical protein